MKKHLVVLQIYSVLSIGIYGQNIGIGTNTPAEKLHVAGNFKADTIKPNALKLTPNAGAGKVLTSDETGNANWQNNITAAAAAGNIGFGAWGDCATNANISEYNPVVDANDEPGDKFGNSVSISGNFALIGNYLDDVDNITDKGSVSVYQHNGSNWMLMQTLTDATGVTGDNFGISVAISGNYAIIGALKDDIGANTNQGSASIYQYNGSSWVLMQKIIDSTGAQGDNFGNSVAIDGDFAVVGAFADDVGTFVDQGSVSIYQYDGSTWRFVQKLTNSDGTVSGENDGEEFGYSVSISFPTIIVGAPFEDDLPQQDEGTASIYTYNSGIWSLSKKLENGLTF